ncbi:MAG: hypothetical protein V9G20_16280 [Candidatus Promineifilaceae bacterium]
MKQAYDSRPHTLPIFPHDKKGTRPRIHPLPPFFSSSSFFPS